MDIGTAVEFEYIVGRKKNGSTVVPDKVPCGKTEGTFIGLARAYDADTLTDPPTLMDFTEVALVAVTSWKRVKVFKEDLVTQNDPSVPAPGPTQIGVGTITPQPLNPVVVAVIEQVIQDEVDEESEFTAWDITKLVRAKLPKTNVPHQAVREVVHNFMSDPQFDGVYGVEPRDYSGNTALTYFPL